MDKETKAYLDFMTDLQTQGLQMRHKFNQLSDDNKQRFWNLPFVQSFFPKNVQHPKLAWLIMPTLVVLLYSSHFSAYNLDYIQK